MGKLNMIQNNMKRTLLPLLCLLAILMNSCVDKEEYGTCTLTFNHLVEQQPLQRHALIYENSAGNPYQIDEVKYFISKLSFLKDDGETVSITEPIAPYVDLDYPETLSTSFSLPVGSYKEMIFTFGLDEELNQTHRFVDSPESNFSWPDIIGGGYHYLQINGKWEDEAGWLQPMNFHTGIGQLYHSNVVTVDSIYDFVHNHFTVQIPCAFLVETEQTTPITLQMEIARWFDTPNIYNHNVFGSGIMQNQEAQKLIKANGHNVFSISNP